MPTNHLYHTWIAQIRELQAGKRITQIRNFVWLMIGFYKSRSVQLSKVAGKIPGQAKLLSATRRLSRFLDNPAIQVREWYEPIARQWLKAQSSWLGQVRLIVDGSKIGCGHQLLMISIAYRQRAIPIAWTWVKHVRGHSTANKQLALLAYVRTLIPQKIPVFLVGDTKFGSVTVIKQLKKWHRVLCATPKNKYVGSSRQTNCLAGFCNSHSKIRAKPLARTRLPDTTISLPDQPLALLASWRKRTLVSGYEPARSVHCITV